MKYKKLVVIFLFVILTMFALSLFTQSKSTDEVSTEALECVCCDGWHVICVEEVEGVTTGLSSEATGNYDYFWCDYCKTTRKFNEWIKKRDYYEYVHYYHECQDCGWYSSGWWDRGDYLYSDVIEVFYKCSICGW